MTGTDGEAIDLDEPRCTSTFVVPGETEVHHCLGRPAHKGVMHGDGKAAWGDGAAADNHPGESLMIRTSVLARTNRVLTDTLRMYGDVLRAVAVLHAGGGEGNTCVQCGGRFPCATAVILGLDRPVPGPTDGEVPV